MSRHSVAAWVIAAVVGAVPVVAAAGGGNPPADPPLIRHEDTLVRFCCCCCSCVWIVVSDLSRPSFVGGLSCRLQVFLTPHNGSTLYHNDIMLELGTVTKVWQRTVAVAAAPTVSPKPAPRTVWRRAQVLAAVHHDYEHHVWSHRHTHSSGVSRRRHVHRHRSDGVPGGPRDAGGCRPAARRRVRRSRCGAVRLPAVGGATYAVRVPHQHVAIRCCRVVVLICRPCLRVRSPLTLGTRFGGDRPDALLPLLRTAAAVATAPALLDATTAASTATQEGTTVHQSSAAQAAAAPAATRAPTAVDLALAACGAVSGGCDLADFTGFLATFRATPTDAARHTVPQPLPVSFNRMSFPSVFHAQQFQLGVEVGTQAGRFAEHILNGCGSCRMLFVVDPWEVQEQYFDTANLMSQSTVMNRAIRRLAPSQRVYFVRDYSVHASSFFPDGLLDFVYVDARHDYVSALEDMRTWWPKVCAGLVQWDAVGRDVTVRPVCRFDPAVCSAATTFWTLPVWR